MVVLVAVEWERIEFGVKGEMVGGWCGRSERVFEECDGSSEEFCERCIG